MMRICKVVFFGCLLVLGMSCLAYGEAEPARVKVGIFYNDDRMKIKKAVDSFMASSDGGLTAQILLKETLLHEFEFQKQQIIGISKDMFYKDEKGSIVLLSSNDTKAQNQSGAYHIKIGGDFSSWEEAFVFAERMKKSGFESFPVFVEGRLEVWSGFYPGEESAKKAIDHLRQALQTDRELQLIVPSEYRTVVSSGDKPLFLVEGETGKLRIGAKISDESTSNIIRLTNGKVKQFRGFIEVLRKKESDMTVINDVSMEEYLYGVVPNEVGAYAHAEAMKAQAVTARTYAQNSMGKHKTQGFDLCDTMHCQVYLGVLGETAKGSKAVDETRGQILQFNGKPAQVFYFSSSGGITEDAVNVWGTAFPYLISVEDTYETGKADYYTWEIRRSAKQVKEYLSKRGMDLGDILDVEIAKRATSGRVTSLVVHGTKGKKEFVRESCRTILNLYSQQYTLQTDADVEIHNGTSTFVKRIGSFSLMTATGLQKINTTKVTVPVMLANEKIVEVPLSPTNYILSGKGWGHAVGMSQDGANGMGLKGFTYKEILDHYFPGTKVQ